MFQFKKKMLRRSSAWTQKAYFCKTVANKAFIAHLYFFYKVKSPYWDYKVFFFIKIRLEVKLLFGGFSLEGKKTRTFEQLQTEYVNAAVKVHV